jgi:hypothetical protein
VGHPGAGGTGRSTPRSLACGITTATTAYDMGREMHGPPRSATSHPVGDGSRLLARKIALAHRQAAWVTKLTRNPGVEIDLASIFPVLP